MAFISQRARASGLGTGGRAAS